MNTIETLRLYLRDQGTTDPRFSDQDLQALLDSAGTTEGAASMGWLLTAADSGDASVSQSVGNTSESWGQPTERYKVAMRMSEYWRSKDEELNGTNDYSVGLWWEMVPDDADGYGTITSLLIEHQQFMQDTYAAT